MMTLKTWRWIALLCALISPFSALAVMTVSNVHVTETADSIATARDKALDEGHRLAYQKLLKEDFPESHRPTPPQDTLMDMVTNFSIDREKTTSDEKTYTASLTFDFDSDLVHEWLQQESSSLPSLTSSSPSPRRGIPLKVTVFFDSLPEWRHVKRTLEESPEGQSVKILALSSKKAHVELPYGGDGYQLQKRLQARGLHLVFQNGKWEIPLKETSFSQSTY